jgi:hypothetical protein
MILEYKSGRNCLFALQTFALESRRKKSQIVNYNI